MLAGVNPQVIKQLQKTNFIDELGAANIFPAGDTLQKSLGRALSAAHKWIEENAQDDAGKESA